MFAVAVFSIDLPRVPASRCPRLKQVVVYSAVIGDSLLRRWNIFTDWPYQLDFSEGVDSAHPTTLRDVYQGANWEYRSSLGATMFFRNAYNSLVGLLLRTH